jgi:hypothetical protein
MCGLRKIVIVWLAKPRIAATMDPVLAIRKEMLFSSTEHSLWYLWREAKTMRRREQ